MPWKAENAGHGRFSNILVVGDYFITLLAGLLNRLAGKDLMKF